MSSLTRAYRAGGGLGFGGTRVMPRTDLDVVTGGDGGSAGNDRSMTVVIG